MTTKWEANPELQRLLDEFKHEVLEGPVLMRPDSALRFYLKTDFCSCGIAAVLMQ
jgi:hypothetical protein